MKQFSYKNIMSIAVLFSMAMLFSCSNNIERVNKLYKTSYFPGGETDDIDLQYTIKGNAVTKLKAQKMLDYTNQKFQYQEFPDGLKLIFIDTKGVESTVTAAYGIVYKKSNLVKFMGDVQLTKPDGTLLKTEVLFYDQNNSHIFTEKSYTFTSPTLDVKGFYGFDANNDFTKFHSGDFLGNVTVKK